MTTPSPSIINVSAAKATAGATITESRGVLSVVLGKEAPQPLVAGQVNKIKAKSGQHWKFVREQTDKTDAVAADNVIAIVQGDDLVLRYEDGTLVRVEGFFAVCTDASVCSVNLPGDTAEGFTFGGDRARGVVLGEEGTLLYAHGAPGALMTMAQGQPMLSTALTGLGESPMVTYRSLSDSFGVGNSTPIILGLLGAGGAVAVAGDSNPTLVRDLTAPTVVITDDEATSTGNIAAGDITYTFTFSEDVTGFAADDVVVANGTKGTFTAISATVYTLVVTPTAGFEGNVTVDVAAGVAQDTGGNNNTAAVQSVQGVDMLAPTAPTAVTLTPSGGTVVSNTLNASNTALAFQATITAGQATGGSAVFKVGGVTVGSDSSISAGDTSVTFSTSDGTPTSAELQSAIAAGGVVTVELVDAAGNTVTSSVGNPTLVRDLTAPTVVITDDEATSTGNIAAGDITYTFTFSEDVTGFAADDVVVANGTKGTFTAISATVYTLVVTPTAGFEGNVTVDVAAGVAQDTGGNNNTAAVQSVQGVDMLAPTAPTAVTLTPSGGTVVSNTLNASNTALAFQATITAGQATGGSAVFKVGGVTVGSDSSISAGDTSVTFSTSDGTPTSAELQSAIAAGGVVTVELVDAAGNTVTSSVGNPTLVRDLTAPTVVITDDEATSTGNIAAGDITYTFTFSEDVTGFAADDVVVANGTKGTFTAISATVYTLVVTPTAGFEGNVTVDVAAGVAQDTGGNNNTAAVQSVQGVDMLAPTAPTAVTLTPSGGTVVSNTLNASNTALAFQATITAGQATGGSAVFKVGGVTVGSDSSISAGDTSVTFSTSDGTPTSAELQSAIAAGGVVTVELVDAAGNTVTSSVGNPTLVRDLTAPTVVITDDEATSTGNIAAGDITYTFTFSEDVTGFAADDVVVANGTKGTFTAISATVYTLVVTPTAGFEGNVTVDVAAGVAQDTGGNNNTAAVQSVQGVDMLAPTAPTAVTLTPSGGTVVSNTLNASNTALAFQATITAGQATGGSAVFKVGGVTVGSDSSISAGDTSVTFSTSDGTPTSAELQSAIAAGGVVTVELVDAAGNTVTSSVGNPTLVRDLTAPTVVITDDEATSTGNIAAGDITYTFTFSEDVTGFAADDVVVANGTKGTFTAISATVYTLVVTPTAGFEGNVTVDVAAGVAQDTGGNNSTAAVQSVQGVDMLAPVFSSAATASVFENTSTATAVYDSNATDANGANDAGIAYTIGGADAALFNIDASTGAVTFKVSPDFEAPVDGGVDNVYDFSVTATDVAGNAATQDVALTVTDAGDAGDTAISLGAGNGQLINGVQVEGKWYYQWDVTGDGRLDLSIIGDPDDDRVSMEYVADTFLGSSATGADITETNRSFTINGVQLVMPKAGMATFAPGQVNGTAWSTATPGWNTDSNSNPTYDDLFAIWDAYNGTDTSTTFSTGIPSSWNNIAAYYWTAESSGTTHGYIGLDSSVGYDSNANFNFVVFQVL